MAGSWRRGRRDGRVSDLFGFARPIRRSIEYSPRLPESRAATYVSGGPAERPDGDSFQPSAQRLAYRNSAEVLGRLVSCRQLRPFGGLAGGNRDVPRI